MQKRAVSFKTIFKKFLSTKKFFVPDEDLISSIPLKQTDNYYHGDNEYNNDENNSKSNTKMWKKYFVVTEFR